MSTTTTDVAVIGGGIIGLASAWRLAQQGLLVTVVDPDPARGATHAAAGMLAPVSEVTYGEDTHLRLSTESLKRYPDFVTEIEQLTGQIVGLRQEGTLIAATDAGDREMLVELHAFQTSLGLVARMLTSRECRAAEAILSPELRCGLLVESDHSIDNRRLARALISAVEAAGGRIQRQRVTSITSDHGTARGVGLATGEALSAGAVVLAAGAWSGEIPDLPGRATPPVRPIKGQILRLRAPDHVPLPDHTVRGLVNGRDIYLVPRADGELVVGATVEELGFDTTVTAGAVRELLRDARAIMPAIDELELVESIASLRPGSPDNLPMIGATDIDGLIVATGHYRNGILLAPITADLVAGTITATGSSNDLELLTMTSPGRFHQSAAKARV